MAVRLLGEPSLDSILKARALQREQLKVVCPIEVCSKIALKLVSWKELCPFIGLDESDEREIDDDYKRHKEKKIGRCALLCHSDVFVSTFVRSVNHHHQRSMPSGLSTNDVGCGMQALSPHLKLILNTCFFPIPRVQWSLYSM